MQSTLLSTKNKKWIIAIGILSLLLIWAIVTYNKFVSKDAKVAKTFSYLQSDYQRRMDLIPNLVNAVKASTDYEKETLTKLVESRASATQGINITGNPTAENFDKIEKLQGEVATNANRVIAVIEKYPDLKSTNAFVRLQDQLIGTERRIKFSRNDFNDAVRDYNQYVRSFPSNLLAGIFGRKRKEGFKADAGTENAPEINFTK